MNERATHIALSIGSVSFLRNSVDGWSRTTYLSFATSALSSVELRPHADSIPEQKENTHRSGGCFFLLVAIAVIVFVLILLWENAARCDLRLLDEHLAYLACHFVKVL